jgi:uncharacterized membrane protein
MIVTGLILAVHLLGAVVWVGGMFYALAVLRPSLASLDGPQRMALHVQTLRRFFLIVWHAMPLILITGYLMVFSLYGGFGGLDWPVNVMQLLGLVMAGIFIVIFFGPWKEMRRAPSPEALNRIRRLITINLGLGLLVVVVASIGHFY